MAFVAGFPSPRSTGVRSLRVFKSAIVASGSDFLSVPNINSLVFYDLDPGYTISAAPSDVATGTLLEFSDETRIGPPYGGGQVRPPENSRIPVPPKPWITSHSIRICNDAVLGSGQDLEFSFDGVNVHGVVLAGTCLVYEFRYESGIALRPLGSGAFAVPYRMEAW